MMPKSNDYIQIASTSEAYIQKGMIAVEIETLAIMLYNEHRAHGNVNGWFDINNETRAVYRSMASGNRKIPMTRKRNS